MSQKELDKGQKYLDKQKYLKAAARFASAAEMLMTEQKIDLSFSTYNKSLKILIEKINSGDRTENLYLLASETIFTLNRTRDQKDFEYPDELNSNIKTLLENIYKLGKNIYFSVCQEIGPLLIDFYERNDTLEKVISLKKELAELFFNEGKKILTIGKSRQKKSAGDILSNAARFMKADEDYVSMLANIEEAINMLEKSELINPIFSVVEAGLEISQKNNAEDAYQRLINKVKGIIENYVDGAITASKWKEISLTNDDMAHMMDSFTIYSENAINKDILLEQLNLVNLICSKLMQQADISILKEWGKFFNNLIIKRLDAEDIEYHLQKILEYFSYIINNRDAIVGKNLFENLYKEIYALDEQNVLVPYIIKEQGKTLINSHDYGSVLKLFSDSFHRYSGLKRTTEAHELLHEIKDIAILTTELEDEELINMFLDEILDAHSKLMAMLGSSEFETERYSIILEIFGKVRERELKKLNDGIIAHLSDISKRLKEPFLLSKVLLYASEYMDISDSILISGLNLAIDGFLEKDQKESAKTLAINVINSLIKNSYLGPKEEAEKLKQAVGKIIQETDKIEEEKIIPLLQKWGFTHEFNSPPYTAVFSFLNQTYTSFKSYNLLDSLLIGHCRGLLKGGFIKEMVDQISNHLSRWNDALVLEALNEWYVPLLDISEKDQDYILDIIKTLIPLIENTERFNEGVKIITKLNVHWASELAKINKMDKALERWSYSKELALKVKDNDIITNIMGSIFSTIHLAIEKSITANRQEGA